MSKKTVMSHDPLDADLPSEAGSDAQASGVEQPIENSAEAPAIEAASDHLRLPDSIGIADVAEVKVFLEPYLSGHESLTIDGSEVDTIDGAGLQLLVGFVREATNQPIALKWDGVSEVLIQAAAHFGVSAVLGLDAPAAAA